MEVLFVIVSKSQRRQGTPCSVFVNGRSCPSTLNGGGVSKVKVLCVFMEKDGSYVWFCVLGPTQ